MQPPGLGAGVAQQRLGPVEDLAAVFAELRAGLSALLEQVAVPIDLQERRHGVRVGAINDRSDRAAGAARPRAGERRCPAGPR
jgi:hypothetical protein